MAKVVGGGGAVGVGGAGKHDEVGGRCNQQLQRYLAAAAQSIVAGPVVEASGGERGIGETAGSRGDAAHLVDDGRWRGTVARAGERGEASIEGLDHGRAAR